MDGPGAIIPNGNILFGAGPINAAGDFLSPCNYFEFDGATHNRTNDPPNANCPTYVTRLLLLPNGEIMFAREDDDSFYAYDAANAAPQAGWRPMIQNCPVNIDAASTIQISGTQFNGLSQATAYGDDSAAATNYPLVRITNGRTRHVRYCRTHGHSTMGVATGGTAVTTNVDIPSDIELGPSRLEVVANGIPSEAREVNVLPPHL